MKNKPSLLDIETFNKNREQELEMEPSILEEDSQPFESRKRTEPDSEMIQLIKNQRGEIDRLAKKLVEVVEQLKVHKELLDKQDREIALLKGRQAGSIDGDQENRQPRQADTGQNRTLILKNIVMLIEEKGFSFNDVARLFKLEGFLPPSPYTIWNDKVVEKLYAITK